jgi:FkbM family methyltransferase
MRLTLGAQAPVRRWLRSAWEFVEARCQNRPGRLFMLAVTRAAMRAQYGTRCQVRYREEGVWEYRWDDAVVLSDRPLLARARPEEMGRLAGIPIEQDFLWDYQPREGDIVMDVGAGIGEELYELTRRVGPNGRVIAVEAHPRPCALLSALVAANGWQNVDVVQIALTDAPGVVTMTDDALYQTNDIFRGGSLEVPADTIVNLAERLGIDHIDFLKMNIEGAEVKALEGVDGHDELIRHATVSCHDFLGIATKAQVREWFEQRGYTVRDHADPPHSSATWFVYASRPAPS